jgi:two-component system sensor histidine kinase KdpD
MAHWPRYLLDGVLACFGSLLITGVIFAFQLYPHVHNISNLYVLVVLTLAITRGWYAAILSAVVAFLSLAYFIVPPLYTLVVIRSEEWMLLFIFLLVGLLTAQLATALHKRAEALRASTREAEQATLWPEQEVYHPF